MKDFFRNLKLCFKLTVKPICKILVYIFYPKKKELADWNPYVVVKYIIPQKILNINYSRKVPWPVHFTSMVQYDPSKFKVGYLSTPGMMPGIYINCMNGIEIGDNVYISPGVKIISANHNVCNYEQHDKAPPIKIGNNVWIGANAIILPGVEIADGCVIGAGEVVTKSFTEENCIIAGNPAKIIRRKKC